MQKPQPQPPLAVTFDFGQTLADLDTVYLSRRLAERGLAVLPSALDAAERAAWASYNAAIKRGEGGHPWRLFMRELLGCAGVAEAPRAEAVEWLWTEQAANNLWRRPVPGMIELVRKLRAEGVLIGVISNSEGRLDELARLLGWRELFHAFADSGRLGIEKPDRRIFDWTCAQLGVESARVVHVGDSFPADVRGALDAGFRGAVWFRGQANGPGYQTARDAAQAELALRAYWTVTSS